MGHAEPATITFQATTDNGVITRYGMMSYTQLYTNPSILLSGSGNPAATILGVPFDSTHSYRPGCRFAPDYIRGMFNNIEVFHPRFGVDLEDMAMNDLGNVIQTVDAAQMIKMVRLVVSEMRKDSPVPIILGGEHLVTLGSYMAFPADTALVVFDAHYDLRDQYAGSKLSHASFLRRIVEKRGSSHILHVGGRAYAAEEAAYAQESQINIISDEDIQNGTHLSKLTEFVQLHDSIYVSMDMDVLDPAFCPGVGNPEACGISSRELFSMTYALSEYNVVGADIVELNPLFDNGAGGTLAAKLLSVMAAMTIYGAE